MDVRKYTVVAVDDDLFILKALRRLLEEDNPPYNLFISTNVKEALTFIQNNKVDLIISDYHMPGVNGFEFFQQADTHSKNTVKILLTGTPDASLNAEAISRLGIYKVLPKPWDSELLKQTVREALRLSKAAI